MVESRAAMNDEQRVVALRAHWQDEDRGAINCDVQCSLPCSCTRDAAIVSTPPRVWLLVPLLPIYSHTQSGFSYHRCTRRLPTPRFLAPLTHRLNPERKNAVRQLRLPPSIGARRTGIWSRSPKGSWSTHVCLPRTYSLQVGTHITIEPPNV